MESKVISKWGSKVSKSIILKNVMTFPHISVSFSSGNETFFMNIVTHISYLLLYMHVYLLFYLHLSLSLSCCGEKRRRRRVRQSWVLSYLEKSLFKWATVVRWLPSSLWRPYGSSHLLEIPQDSFFYICALFFFYLCIFLSLSPLLSLSLSQHCTFIVASHSHCL